MDKTIIYRIRIPGYYRDALLICKHLLEMGYSVKMSNDFVNLNPNELGETVIEYRRGEL